MAMLNNERVFIYNIYIFLSSWYTWVLITKSVEPSLRVETLDELSRFFWSNIQNYWALPCSGFSLYIIPLSNIKNPKALWENDLVLECVGIHLGGSVLGHIECLGKGLVWLTVNFLPMSFDHASKRSSYARTFSGSQKHPKTLIEWRWQGLKDSASPPKAFLTFFMGETTSSLRAPNCGKKTPFNGSFIYASKANQAANRGYQLGVSQKWGSL